MNVSTLTLFQPLHTIRLCGVFRIAANAVGKPSPLIFRTDSLLGGVEEASETDSFHHRR